MRECVTKIANCECFLRKITNPRMCTITLTNFISENPDNRKLKRKKKDNPVSCIRVPQDWLRAEGALPLAHWSLPRRPRALTAAQRTWGGCKSRPRAGGSSPDGSPGHCAPPGTATAWRFRGTLKRRAINSKARHQRKNDGNSDESCKCQSKRRENSLV